MSKKLIFNIFFTSKIRYQIRNQDWQVSKMCEHVFLFNEEPCCIPSAEIDPYLGPFSDGEPIPQVEKFIEATSNQQYDKIDCRSDYGLKNDDKNHCFMINYPTVTCEGKLP